MVVFNCEQISRVISIWSKHILVKRNNQSNSFNAIEIRLRRHISMYFLKENTKKKMASVQ